MMLLKIIFWMLEGAAMVGVGLFVVLVFVWLLSKLGLGKLIQKMLDDIFA